MDGAPAAHGWDVVRWVLSEYDAQCTASFERTEDPVECPLQREQVIVGQGVFLGIQCGKPKDISGPNCADGV